MYRGAYIALVEKSLIQFRRSSQYRYHNLRRQRLLCIKLKLYNFIKAEGHNEHTASIKFDVSQDEIIKLCNLGEKHYTDEQSKQAKPSMKKQSTKLATVAALKVGHLTMPVQETAFDHGINEQSKCVTAMRLMGSYDADTVRKQMDRLVNLVIDNGCSKGWDESYTYLQVGHSEGYWEGAINNSVNRQVVSANTSTVLTSLIANSCTFN